MQVIFSKIELGISPFLTVIQFYKTMYSNIGKKRVGKSPQEISVRTSEKQSEIYLLTLKEQGKTKMELPLDMVSKHAFWYPYLPDYKT